MGAVEFDAVEADALGGHRGLDERVDDVVQVLLRHLLAGTGGAVQAQAGRADGRGVGVRGLPGLPHHADVPQLRHDLPAGRVHGLGDLRPPRELLLAVETGDAVVLTGRVVADVRALGDDQADARCRAPGVVRGHVLAGDPAGRERARHRRHHDPVRHGQAVQLDGAGEDLGRAGGLGGGCHVGTPGRGGRVAGQTEVQLCACASTVTGRPRIPVPAHGAL